MAIFQVSARLLVSTHSRPKAAARGEIRYYQYFNVSTHSRPKAAALVVKLLLMHKLFQHTAARRRLPISLVHFAPPKPSFNTQPPEGGCNQPFLIGFQ